MMENGEIVESRYKVEYALGEGGMAIVYKCQDLITNNSVALKIIKEDTMKNPVNLTRFEREARAAASLNHNNIVRVITIGSYNGRPYIVNEFIKGKTLKDALTQRGKFSIEEALEIMYQLCNAVLYAHQHNVVHRDIKPQNVYLLNDGTIKLGDFGIATFTNGAHVTRSEIVVGSVHYLAPELSQGNVATPQSDIYALGITFYELITGRLPFDADSPVMVALKHIKEKFPSPRKYNSKTPQIVEKMITKCCAKHPTDRYRTVHTLRDEIKKCIDNPKLLEKKTGFFSKIFGKKDA